MKTITIKVKSVYGNYLMYPGCEAAKHFTTISRRLTFDLNDLNAIKALGFEILTEDGNVFKFSKL